MEIIKIKDENIINIAKEIREGKIVIFPTETVYGIGTNALNEKSCEKIYQIKNRVKEKPLIVLISNKNMLKMVAKDINEIEKKLMDTFWPGPLTIILKKQSNIPDIITAGKDEVSVRMTSGKIANKLIEKAEVPIVAPSANLSGKPTGTKPEQIAIDFENKVDYMIDIGNISSDITSTIVKVIDKKICIIREGKIKREELEKVAEVVI